MTNTDLKLNLGDFLALRAELLGDMTKMKDDSLQDQAKTNSIPVVGSGPLVERPAHSTAI